MAARDDVVLSFHDSLIRKSDFSLLGKTCWLNDNVIGFAFEYFEKEVFAEFSSVVSFVGPHVTQCFKMMSFDEAKLLIEPLDLTKKELAFFAVSDHMSEDAGGTHWSLLVLSVTNKICYHYDSLSDQNRESAKQIFVILNKIFKGSLKFEESSCPKQTNSHDCGVYVICFAEHLCHHFCHSKALSLSDVIVPATVSKKREELKSLILNLAKQRSL